MKYSLCLFAAAASAASIGRAPKPDAEGKYTLEAPGIKAQVLSFSYCH